MLRIVSIMFWVGMILTLICVNIKLSAHVKQDASGREVKPVEPLPKPVEPLPKPVTPRQKPPRNQFRAWGQAEKEGHALKFH